METQTTFYNSALLSSSSNSVQTHPKGQQQRILTQFGTEPGHGTGRLLRYLARMLPGAVTQPAGLRNLIFQQKGVFITFR